VVLRYDQPDHELSAQAAREGIQIFRPRRANAPSFVQTLQGLEPDIVVSIAYDQIFREGLCSAARIAAINCHAGALPFYRGRNVLNWALINGETQIGVTVHMIEPHRIDTGDIVRQDFVPITADDDYASVLHKAQQQCPRTVTAAVRDLIEGSAELVPQDSIHSQGFYCGGREEGDEWIEWNWPSARIHNFVRGITHPAPGARAVVRGNELVVWRTALIPRAVDFIGTPGQVIGRDAEGIVVKTGDNQIRVTLISELGDDGAPLEPRIPRFKIGTRFGVNLLAEYLRMKRLLERLCHEGTVPTE
jgi:methionyl-tRNA formyltransferase